MLHKSQDTSAVLSARENTSSHKPRRIAIVGGSLAGLFTGVALKQQGYHTTILESNPSKVLKDQGAGIVAGGDTLLFFQRHDRYNSQMAVSSNKRLYLDQTGKVVHEVLKDHRMTSWDLCYYVLRANYDNLESDYVNKKPASKETDGDVEYLNGCTVKDFSLVEEDAGPEAGKVKVEYETSDGKRKTLYTDLLIGADGPNSTVRRRLCPSAERVYAGYVVIRGTVPEKEIGEEAKNLFTESFTFYHGYECQSLAYIIPGQNGSLVPGERLLNIAWYANYPDGSQEKEELMTDLDGRHHRITLPQGKMSLEVWEKIKAQARDNLPPQKVHVIEKIRNPFVQAITDVIAPTNIYHVGKVVLIGDALAGFRPHTGASTSQAAYDVMLLVEWLHGNLTDEEFRRDTMKFARLVQQRGVKMGIRSQYDKLPLTDYMSDRDAASKKRDDEVYEDWMLQ